MTRWKCGAASLALTMPTVTLPNASRLQTLFPGYYKTSIAIEALTAQKSQLLRSIQYTTMGSLEFKDLFTQDGTVYGDWRDGFHMTGCVVVKKVISPERAAYYRQKQIEWLQSGAARIISLSYSG